MRPEAPEYPSRAGCSKLAGSCRLVLVRPVKDDLKIQIWRTSRLSVKKPVTRSTRPMSHLGATQSSLKRTKTTLNPPRPLGRGKATFKKQRGRLWYVCSTDNLYKKLKSENSEITIPHTC